MDSSRKEKVSSRQAFYIVLGGIIGDAFLSLPKSAVEIGDQNGWLASLIVSLFLLLSATVVGKLGSLFPGATVIEGAGEILGKWLGKLYGLALVFAYGLTTVVVVRSMPFIVKLVLLPQAPIWFIVLTYAFVCAAGASVGVEVVARVNELLMPIVVILLFLIMFMVLPFVNYERIFPLFQGFDWKALFTADGVNLYYGSSAYLLLFMVLPYMLRPREGIAAAQKAVGFAGVIYAAGIAVAIMVLSPAVIKANVWPTMRLVAAIGFRGFLIERMDIIFAFLWLIAGYTTALNFYYATVESTRRFLGIAEKNNFYIISAWYVIICGAALFIKNFGQQVQIATLAGIVMLGVGFFLSALLLMIAGVRGKGRENSAKPQKIPHDS